MVSRRFWWWCGYSEGVVGEGETGESRHPAGDLTQQGFDGGEMSPVQLVAVVAVVLVP